MSCEPQVIETLGWLDESEYPLQIGGAEPPEQGYCIDGRPGFTPHGRFDFQSTRLTYTLSELASFSFGGTQFRRGWFLAPATAQNNRVAIVNETARPMEVVLTMSASQNFILVSGDAPNVGDYFLATWSATVFDILATQPGASYPKAAYAGYGTDTQVFQVSPSLKLTYRHDLGVDRKKHYHSRAAGALPPLQPGHGYIAEPGVYHLIGPGVATFDSSGDTGTYTSGTIGLSFMGWSQRV